MNYYYTCQDINKESSVRFGMAQAWAKPQNKYAADCCVSIDVECAATGHGHLDQEPCRIAMVDSDGNTLFDMITKVPNMTDPLTEYTGLNEQQIQRGVDLEVALAKLHKMLIYFEDSHNLGVTIVGQGIHNDIMWTQLKKGVHYSLAVDLAPMFKTVFYYSLRQCVWALLQKDMRQNFHCPAEDARCSIELYKRFAFDPFALKKAKELLATMSAAKVFPNFYISTKYRRCNGMYSRMRCWCKQPVMAGVSNVDEMRKLMKGVQVVDKISIDDSPKDTGNWVKEGVCRPWQNNGECRFYRCRFLHVCNKCGEDHPQSQCS